MQPQNKEDLLDKAQEVGGFDIYHDGNEEFSVYEDDGHICINHFGLRLIPDMNEGQGSKRGAFNKEASAWVQALGYDYKHNVKGVV